MPPKTITLRHPTTVNDGGVQKKSRATKTRLISTDDDLLVNDLDQSQTPTNNSSIRLTRNNEPLVDDRRRGRAAIESLHTSEQLSADDILSKKYQKLEHRDHVLHRSDTYVGKKSLHENELYVFEDDMIVKRDVQYVPALYKIFDEGLVNMRDHVERMRVSAYKQGLLEKNLKIDDDTITLETVYRPVKKISVSVDHINNVITMTNDGNGLEIVQHPVHQIYIPELIFFQLLSGSNFDDKQERTWGGKNGYGAKLISIFSTECTIETVDGVRKKKYVQTCRDNMRIVDPPVITTCKLAPYTKFSFKPDLSLFGITGLNSYDHLALFQKRVYDIAACTSQTVHVSYNEKTLPIRDFGKYVELYPGPKRIAIKPNECWEVYVGLSQGGKFEHVSFVNGVNTNDGGKHVDHVTTILVNKLVDAIVKTKKQLKDVKPAMIKNLLAVFINSTIVNPDFNNQMKEALTTTSKDFSTKMLGKPFKLEEDDIKPLLAPKMGLIDALIATLLEKDQKNFDKIGGRIGRNRDLKAIPAKYAGTAKWSDCILILTEGDSARTMAVSGLEACDSEMQNHIGIMPLKGKLINVKTSSLDKVLKNEEFERLLTNMGLKPGDRECKGKLNYGHIAVLTDADHDGYHIKGLLFNMFHKFWPSLLKRPGFFLSVRTPIIGFTHKKTGEKQFLYTYLDWEDWKAANGHVLQDYKYKYYKGLGSHPPLESREIFQKLQYIDYTWDNDLSYQWLDLENKQRGFNNLAQDEIISRETEENDLMGGDPPSENDSQSSSNDSEEIDIESSVPSGSLNQAVLNQNCFKKLKNVWTLFQHPDGAPVDYCDLSLKLAFEGKDNGRDNMPDYRKDWILKYLAKKTENAINYQFQRQKSISYFNFINSELIEFSIEDVQRSIPSLMDGLKPSQRKIMYRCLKRPKPFSQIRVDQLAGNISENTNYHHGNESLIEAIIWLAQDFVGTNNINLLVPEGGFGSRLGSAPKKISKSKIGKDHAAARYLHTYLNEIVPLVFDSRDTPLLSRVKDEGKLWEPHFYLPTIPLILINGSKGIGTGFSTNIPCFNPVDVVANMKRFLHEQPLETMLPYYHGFRGSVTPINSQRFKVTGCYQIDRINQTMTITELPVGNVSCMSYIKYKDFLYKFLEKEVDVDTKGGPKQKKSRRHLPDIVSGIEIIKFSASFFHVVITFQEGKLANFSDEQLEKLFRLSTTLPTSNMNLYTPEGMLKHYDSANDILVEFMKYRIKWYEQRRLYYLNKLLEECQILTEKARFIGLEIDETNDFTIRKKKQVEVINLLKSHQFEPESVIKKRYQITGMTEYSLETEADEDADGDADGDEKTKTVATTSATSLEYHDYKYLVKMSIDQQTVEKIDKLNAERQKKLVEVEEYRETTANKLYITDLSSLMTGYENYLVNWNKTHMLGNNDNTTTKGTMIRKPRAKRAIK